MMRRCYNVYLLVRVLRQAKLHWHAKLEEEEFLKVQQ